nr:transposase [endosymbiont GvMRE of Glomus versiforme]
MPPQMPLSEIKKMLGIDRGVRKILAISEGWKLFNPEYWNKIEKKYIEFQRSLDRKVKGSSNWKKVKSKMSSMGKKTSNRMKDLCHKTSRELVDKSDLLALEKLETSKMVSKENKKVGKWTRDGMLKACWGKLAFFIVYKAKGAGKWYMFVSPSNTSKRCSNANCGKINKELKDEETFLCPSCGYKEDRDVNAAKNILWKAQKKLGLIKTG